MRCVRRLPKPLHYIWAALYRDGGEYGIWCAITGGILWVAITAAWSAFLILVVIH